MKKSIHTALDIKGVVYLSNYIQEQYFSQSSAMTSVEYKEMAILMEEESGNKVSESTIERFFSITKNPHPISYRKLDLIVEWCFKGQEKPPWNFKDFLMQFEKDLVESSLIDESNVNKIVDSLTKKNGTDINKNSIAKTNVSLDINGNLISFTSDEGSVEKLIHEIAIVVGDMFKNQGKRDHIKVTDFNKQSINERLTIRENRRQDNIDSIIVRAIEFAREVESSDDPVDPDWVVEFFNIAQDCSDENMQYLWARLLANEIAEPNSFSRRTLTTIKMLNAYEAQIFSKLCCCIWDLEESHFGREKMLLKDMDSNGRYSDETWGFNGSFISHLEEVGLVYDSFLQLDEKRVYNASFFGNEYQLKASESEQQIDLVALTQVGQEIFRIVNPTPNKEYFQHTLEYFEKINILI